MIITHAVEHHIYQRTLPRRLTIRHRILENVYQTRYPGYTPYSCLSINDIFIFIFHVTHDTQCRILWVVCYTQLA